MDKTLELEKKVKELEVEIKSLREVLEELIYLFVEHNGSMVNNESHVGINIQENEEETIKVFKLLFSKASKEEKEENYKNLVYIGTKIFPIYDKVNKKKNERLKEVIESL